MSADNEESAGADQLKRKVRDWLLREGYPFELRIGRQLLGAGFHDIAHGRFFRDLDTEKWREIDVMAFALAKPFFEQGEGQSRPPLIGVRFVVECKHGHRPWVVMASPTSPAQNQFPSSFLEGRVATALLRQAEMPDISPGGASGTGLSLEAFSFGAYLGHNVVQTAALTRSESKGDKLGPESQGQPNAAYSAVRSVVAAAGAVAKQVNDAQIEQLKLKQPLSGMSVILPVIVCNAPMFRLSLSEGGEESLDEIDEAAIAAPPSGDRDGGLRLVRIVRPGAPLNALARRAIADAETVATILRDRWPEYSRRAMQSLRIET